MYICREYGYPKRSKSLPPNHVSWPKTPGLPTIFWTWNLAVYPPVMTNIANWKITIEMVDLPIQIAWGCSIAMLVITSS